MPHYITLCAVSRNPNGMVLPVGGFDEAGNVIFRAATTTHAPEAILELTDEAEIAFLLAADAIRPATTVDEARVAARAL